MNLYDCHVRLSNGTNNEVPRYGVTVSEIYVLRDIHGQDAVVRIKPAGSTERDDEMERKHLSLCYNPNVVAKLFGQMHQALPDRLDPRTEALIEEAVKGKEAMEDVKRLENKALFEEAVQREVKRRMALDERARTQKAINEDSDVPMQTGLPDSQYSASAEADDEDETVPSIPAVPLSSFKKKEDGEPAGILKA